MRIENENLRRTGVGLLALCCLLVGSALIAEEEKTFGIRDAVSPGDGVLFAGQPTAEQIDALAEAGYASVIDLRGIDEDRGFAEAAKVGAAGLGYHPIPVTRDTMSNPNTYERFFDIFEEAPRPVLVHCAAGSRVGALYYAYLVERQGLSREEAEAKAEKNGLRSEQLKSAMDQYLDHSRE